MDTKLLTPEECYEKFIPAKCCQDALDLFKEVQRNAIEVAVQRCNEDAEADYETVDNYVGLIIEPTIETEKVDPIEVYVINSSILDCKQKLFEENNL